MPHFIEGWRRAFRSREFRDQGLVTLAALAVTLVLMGAFLNFIGARMGPVLDDPVLPLLPDANLLWITFTLIYAGFLIGLISLAMSPFSLLLALRACVVLLVLRAICLWLLPLDPPAGAVSLVDPFLRAPGFPRVPVRDLFFSWHAALLSLLAFTSHWRDLKVVFALLTVAVSALMLVQHAHYTIDLVAAPCFAYASYGFARWVTVEEVVTGRATGNTAIRG